MRNLGLMPRANDLLVYSVALCSPFAQVINSAIFGPESPISITLLAAMPLAATGLLYVVSRTQSAGWWLMFGFFASLISIELCRLALFSLPVDPKGLVTYVLVPFITIGFLKMKPLNLSVSFILLSLALCGLGMALFLFYVVKNGMSLTTFGASLPLSKQDFNVGITLGVVGSLYLLLSSELNRQALLAIVAVLLVQLGIGIFVLSIKSILIAFIGAASVTILVRGRSNLLLYGAAAAVLILLTLNFYGENILPENIQTLVTYFKGGNVSGYDARYIDTLWLRQQIININLEEMWESPITVLFGLGHNAASGSAVTSPNSGLVTILPRDVESGWAWFFFQFGAFGTVLVVAILLVSISAYIRRRRQANIASSFWAIAGGAMIIGNIAQDNLNLLFWIIFAGFISACGIGNRATVRVSQDEIQASKHENDLTRTTTKFVSAAY